MERIYPESPAGFCAWKRIALLTTVMLLIQAIPAFAQQHTASLTSGWNYSPNSWERYIEGPTYGLDYTWEWEGVHAQNHRAPFLMGLKANMAYAPNGIAGNRYGASAFVTTPFVLVNRILYPGDLSLQLGGGLGIYPRPWDRTQDPLNSFIGGYLNAVIDVGLVYSQPISKAGALVFGAKFVHNSNGMLCMPNQGLNYVQGELGWRFKGKKEAESGKRSTLEVSEKDDARTGGFVMLATGFSVPRNELAGNKELYPAYTVQFGWRYAYQHCRSIALCAEMAYNFADNFEYHLTGSPTPFPMFAGVSLMHETHWGPVSFRAGAGYHLFQSFPDGKVFERVGAFYHFGENSRQFAGVSIKANILHADFIEWSYGIDLW